MTDPYKVLGVSPSATDDEVKDAYRKLAKKYHPDQYADSPLKDLADEKMKEINEAYDAITAQRKGGGAGRGYNGAYNNVGANGSSGFNDVRSLIMSGRIATRSRSSTACPPSGATPSGISSRLCALPPGLGWRRPRTTFPGPVRWTPATQSTARP